MSFQSREEYEAWKRRAAAPPASRPPDARPTPEETDPADATGAPDDIILRLSPLYGGLVLGAGFLFVAIGFLPFGKAGPTFHTICVLVGLAAIPGGILLLRNRRVVARLTSTALHLQGAVIPWSAIESLERVRDRRNYWIGIHLKTKRTDLDSSALIARAALRAMGSPGADFDYSILETDLPRSGPWFLEECRRRMAAAGDASSR